jgi:hypothetical protein
MICRPFKLGVFIPGGCPSRQQCSDTVTVCGRCLDCYVPDNFLFGVMAGWVDVPLAEMEVMGWTAKLVKTFPDVVPGHVISEELWQAGYAFGRAAHENARAGRPYHLDRATLERDLRVALSRDDCGPCDKPASGLRLDFSEEPW